MTAPPTTAPDVVASATADRVRPRDVFSPTAHLHRDREVADDAVAGRFTYAGVRLDLGPAPDWRTGGLADDEEWHIEWSKFTFGLDLAHAFAQTGQRRYLDTWTRLVESWIEQREPGADTSDVTARRLQHWVFTWQLFDRAAGFGGLAPRTQARLLASVADQLAHVRATLSPERNHRTLELFALLVVPLALPVLDPGGRAAAQAWDLLQDNLFTDVWPDGVHRERSTHYHLIALRSFVAARVNVARTGGVVPAAYDERLRAACRFGMHVHRPDGVVPAFSDSDSGSYLDLLALAADVLDDDELRWVAGSGSAGRAPRTAGADFPVAGYHTQRSGWGVDEPYAHERFLLLGAGPLGDGGHGHYDALGLEAYAAGHPLVVDPGRYTYAELPCDPTELSDPTDPTHRSDRRDAGCAPPPANWRHWFKGTAAHNTVTVDGLDQQPYRRGKPKGPQAAARLVGRRATAGLDVLEGEATSPAYDAVHGRVVTFVGGAYWLVADTLRAPTPHAYAVRWHLATAARPEVAVDGRVTRVTTPTVRIDSAGTRSVAVEPGWVAPGYGVRTPAPVVVGRAQGELAEVVTLLAANGPDGSPTLLRADPALGVAVVALPAGGTDLVGWRGFPVSVAGLAVTADLTWVRRDVADRLVAVCLHRPTSVAWTGDGPAPTLAADGEWLVWSAETS